MSKINEVVIRSDYKTPIKSFLETHDYIFEEINENIFKVVRDQIEVFLNIDDKNIFFQLEVGGVKSFENSETHCDLYRDILDLNTEILPVSLALDTTTKDNPLLVIIESRETANLDENEILSVFESMEIALFKVENLIQKYINKK